MPEQSELPQQQGKNRKIIIESRKEEMIMSKFMDIGVQKQYDSATVYQATKNALKEYPGMAVVFSGGVASNSLLREKIAPLNPIFAKPEFSTDNAMGVAVLAYRQMEG